MGGKHTARYAYKVYSGAASDLAYEATNRRKTAESERAAIEAGLGSADQVAGRGDFAGDPRIGNYTPRYTLSPYSASVGSYGKGPRPEALNEQMNSANALLEKAEAAARNGQWDVAEDFRNQAQAGLANFGNSQVGPGGNPRPAAGSWQEFFNLERDPIEGANATLSSPMARIVGADVARAGEIRDPNSATYRSMYSSLTEPGQAEIEGGYTKAARTLTQGLASGRREAQDMAAGRGAGRNALGEMNLMARINESANAELANARLDADIAKGKLFADATQFMISYGDNFRKNTVQYARDWVNGAAFVRDDYVQAQNQMSVFSSQIFQQRASEEAAYAATQDAKAGARADYYRNLIIAASTVVVTAGIGAIAGGALGTGVAAGAWAGVKVGATIVGGAQIGNISIGGSGQQPIQGEPQTGVTP